MGREGGSANGGSVDFTLRQPPVDHAEQFDRKEAVLNKTFAPVIGGKLAYNAPD